MKAPTLNEILGGDPLEVVRKLEDLTRTLKDLKMTIIHTSVLPAWAQPGMDRSTYGVMSVVADEVCKVWDCSEAGLFGRLRTPNVAQARMAAMVLAREFLASGSEVARLFNRDHGTFGHAVKTLADQVETEPKTAERVRKARAAIRARLNPATPIPATPLPA